MRLENLLALTNGKVVNSPFVKQFTNIVFEAKKVKRGDLFIAFDDDTLEEAVLNGAYGVMFDKPTQISDQEIAWIKVDSLDDALKRLLRFRLIEKEIVVYECNEIVLKLALQVMSETNFIALQGDIKTIYKTLWDLEDLNTILFSPALTSKDLFTDIKQFPNNERKEKITVMEQTLFETSFVYDDVFYERQLVSPFFVPFLEDLFNFFKVLQINFRLKKFTPIDHFEAVFTNKSFEIKEFGTSDKVLIFEKNTMLIEKQIVFLQKQAPWAQIIYLIPEVLAKELGDQTGIFGYKSTNEILNILKTNQFHFALIVGASKEILTKPLTNQAQISLFDFNQG